MQEGLCLCLALVASVEQPLLQQLQLLVQMQEVLGWSQVLVAIVELEVFH